MALIRFLVMLVKALWWPFHAVLGLLGFTAGGVRPVAIAVPVAERASASTDRLHTRRRNQAAARRRRTMKLAVALAVVLGALLGALVASSFFSATSTAQANTVTAGTIGQGATPSGTTDGTTVTLTFATVYVGGNEIGTYHVTRYTSAGTGATPIGGTCSALASHVVTCTDVPGGGQWKYTDTPYFNNWVGTESAMSAMVVTDNTAPTSAITFPAAGGAYNNSGWNGGCLSTICGTANDPGAGASGVHDVQLSIEGPGNTYWNGSSFTSAGEVKFTVTGTTAWSYAFSSSNLATTGGGDGTYTVRSYATDNASNVQSPATTVTFTLDNTPPTDSISLAASPAPVGAFMSGSTVYFNNSAPGSATFLDTVTDTGSGPASAIFTGLAQWTSCAAVTVTTPTGGPYAHACSWSAGDLTPGPHTWKSTDDAGNTSAGELITFVNDTTAPSGGSTSYPDGFYKTASVAISTTNGTDAGAGVDPTSGIVKRDQTSLSNGTCGTFPGTYATTVTLVGGADTSVTDGHCYKYEYLVSDNVGNQATYTSANVAKVDTTAPADSLSLSAPANAFLSGGTLYFNSKTSGSFTMADQVTDSGSGPASATFPAVPATGGWSGHTTSDTVSSGIGSAPAITYKSSTAYSWTGSSGSPATAPAGVTVTSKDAAGNTSAGAAITFAADVTPPSGGSIGYTDGYYTSSSVGITTTNGTDTGSGVNGASGVIKRDQVALSGGACGTFPASFATTVTLVDGADTSVVSGFCYRYEYQVADNVGNVATYTSTNVAKVDTSAPALSISSTGTGVSSSGNTIFFTQGGTGTFTLTVTDLESGVATASFPTISGWTSGSVVTTATTKALTYTLAGATTAATPTVSATNGAGTSATLPLTISLNTPVTYTSPGTYTLGIPAGTTVVNYTIIGGGGAGGATNGGKAGGIGGSATIVNGTIMLNTNPSGVILTVVVAGGGLTATTTTGGAGGTGLGAGGSAGDSGVVASGGGGGASGIEGGTTPTALSIAAGGGGGGAGQNSAGFAGGAGGLFGAGTTSTGTAGLPSTGGGVRGGGQGGGGAGGSTFGTTPFAATGGAGGGADHGGPGVGHQVGGQGSPTSAGAGPGTGGVGGLSPDGVGGGGGGGGWAGGGGGGGSAPGPGASGGGGSSYFSASGTISGSSITYTITATATNSLSGSGFRGNASGNGQDGSASFTGGAIYNPALAPNVTNVTPVAGPAAGGNTVTISGSNFSGATSVKFGTTVATILTNTGTTITVTAPLGTTSTTPVDVTVTGPSGTSATSSADHYTYDGTPTITNVSPNTGSTAGGTSVTLTGTGFLTATAVTFGSAGTGTGLSIASDTSLTIVAPAAASAGAVNVTVTNTTGTSSSTAMYTYVAPPTATSVSTTSSGSKAAGATIPVTVTFSSAVNATGHPTLTLNTSPSEVATYASGDGTNTLTFNYTVASGDGSTRLDYPSVGSLALGGGSIVGTGSAVPATLTLPTPAGPGDNLYSQNVVVDTSAPVVAITSINGSARSFPYTTNQNITSVGGSCGILIGDLAPITVTDNGSATHPVTASCVGGSWTLTLTTPISSSATHSLVATQSDQAGNSGTDTESVVIDKIAPTVSSINIAGTSPASSGPLTWTVVFSKPVSGVTTTNFALAFTTTGSAPVLTSATAVGGAPSATWTVSASTTGTAGTSTTTIGLNLANGSGVTDAVGNALGTSTFTGQPYIYNTATPVNVSFSTTGSHTLMIPAGTTTVSYTLGGGGGGGGATNSGSGGTGGAGAAISGTITLSSNPSGVTLTVLVAGAGGASATAAGGLAGTSTVAPGGVGGGGGGGVLGSGGGGAGSVIEASGSTVLIVAAGGGGGGSGSKMGNVTGSNGGLAGLFTSPFANPGSAGTNGGGGGAPGGQGVGGKGGVTASLTPFGATGGAGGGADGPHVSGTSGTPASGAGPGSGGTGGAGTDGPGGGGGGGGWAGGGGAASSAPNQSGSGGGGGSSYFGSATVSSITYTASISATPTNPSSGSGTGGTSGHAGQDGSASFSGIGITGT